MNESLRQPIRNRLTDRVGKHLDTGKAAETRDDFCQVRDLGLAVLYHSAAASAYTSPSLRAPTAQISQISTSVAVIR